MKRNKILVFNVDYRHYVNFLYYLFALDGTRMGSTYPYRVLIGTCIIKDINEKISNFAVFILFNNAVIHEQTRVVANPVYIRLGSNYVHT